MRKTLDRIHANSLRILNEVGMKLHSAEALDLLRRNGARVQGDVARIPPQMTEECIALAPEFFELEAADPAKNVALGGGSGIMAPGFGSPAITKWTGERRDAVLEDYIVFAKLTQASGSLHLNGGLLVHPCDVPAGMAHLVMIYAALMLSDQPMMGYAGGGEVTREVAGLIELRMGGRKTEQPNPGALFMVSPMSPLQMDPLSLGTLFSAVRRGHGVIISPAPVPGITGPVELAGNLSQATAEALAGVVLAQLAQPGCPVLFGPQCYGSDLRRGNISVGSPAYSLQSKYCAELARRYGMPSRGGGGPNDARGVTARSGMESMFNLMSSVQNRLDLIIHAAGSLDRFAAMSHEKFMLDLEALAMLEFCQAGVKADTDEHLSFDSIARVGFGGNYLTMPETLQKARDTGWLSSLESRGLPSAGEPHNALCEVLQEREADMLHTYRPPAMSPGLISAMDDYMLAYKVPRYILDQVKAARESNASPLCRLNSAG